MKFIETELKGAYIIEPEHLEDERGFFARTFCEQEFAAHGLEIRFVQCSVSFNRRKGTLRGLHYQAAPHAEVKLVRCTAGAAFDVFVDIRPGSPTYKRWLGVELSSGNHKMLYIPEGFAHGFQSLEDRTELFYQISKAHAPEAARGIRWDDPAIGISWPMKPLVVSARDQGFPVLSASK
jgi:dTDP-4-dehydrorhamnose 3,5-epimerase